MDSAKGGKILSFAGYLYSRHSENRDGSRTYWMCRRRPVCKKRAITSTPAGLSNGQFFQHQKLKFAILKLFGVYCCQRARSVVGVFKSLDHDHPPAPEEGQAIRAYNRLKRAAKEHPEAPPAQILRQDKPDVSTKIPQNISYFDLFKISLEISNKISEICRCQKKPCRTCQNDRR